MVQTSVLYSSTAPLTVRELARKVAGSVEGDDAALIRGVSSIEDAEFGDIVFAENPRFLIQARQSKASAIVAFVDATTPDKPLIKVTNPRLAFAQILEMFAPIIPQTPGVHESAQLGVGAEIAPDASIGPNVVVGDHATVGPGATVLANCVIGAQCTIGTGCILYPGVLLYPRVSLGARVTVHSGTVIGADGFGYMRIGDASYKVPQVGTVDVQDDVEIGANCTIDRAKTGATVIGARTKIDNLVHIAHNVRIGTDCIIVAQVGIAGSSVLGRGVILAGQVGINDHVEIGDGAIVHAQGGVFGNVSAGEEVSGYPARNHRKKLRQEAAAASLPDYIKRIRQLERDNRVLAETLAKLEVTVTQLSSILGSQATDAG